MQDLQDGLGSAVGCQHKPHVDKTVWRVIAPGGRLHWAAYTCAAMEPAVNHSDRKRYVLLAVAYVRSYVQVIFYSLLQSFLNFNFLERLYDIALLDVVVSGNA